jgi:hypothetical protein
MIAVATAIVGWRGPDELARGEAFRNLVFLPAVSDNLSLLFEKFDTELVLCLEGERRGADLYVTDFRMPHIFVSATGRVQAASCKPSPRSVGTWHNHPSPRFSLASAGPEARARNCYLSRTDIHDFQRRADAQVTVVACAPRTYAFWKRSDIEEAASEVALLLPPFEQLVRSEVPADREDSGLTQARGR